MTESLSWTMRHFLQRRVNNAELGKNQTKSNSNSKCKMGPSSETSSKRAVATQGRGFQDPDYLSLEKNSPTANKTSKMVLLDSTIYCADVRAAILSGVKVDREIIVKLPSDCSALLGNKSPTYMKMRMSAYGLRDAPLLWWTEADRYLRALNLKRRRLRKCTYMMDSSSNLLAGMLIVHVDDLLMSFNMRQ